MSDQPFVIEENKLLATRNTFGLHTTSKYFVEASSEDHILEALTFANDKKLEVVVLGGGSNVVLAPFLDSVVISISTKGVEVDGNKVCVSAGENWHNLVRTTLAMGLSGLENLSLIPGSVGAAPIQNIGAYGVEIQSFISSVTVLDRCSLAFQTLDTRQCEFGYRTSVFKERLRNRVVVTAVSLVLAEKFEPRLEYPELRTKIDETLGRDFRSRHDDGSGVYDPDLDYPESGFTAKAVSDAVINIRQSKLPDPYQIGNVGSFFKNPVISASKFKKIRLVAPKVGGVIMPDGKIKLSAASMIDQAGLKGTRIGGAGISHQHALVFTNEQKASFADVQELANLVVTEVSDRFGVTLEIEPVIYQ
ncbi:MAG: UDP-N-acetylmuramate dehydrogenase [Candidatus Azotimanducaceae bacterium]|jgi:UDP-N-acetylmuramate dehydrogenase